MLEFLLKFVYNMNMKSKFGSRKMIDGKKVCGIVCEYNPFHNGHKYQIDQTRRLGYDYIICAMSGSMVQRGDVAVYDKWFRAKTAVENGADLVIEGILCPAIRTKLCSRRRETDRFSRNSRRAVVRK